MLRRGLGSGVIVDRRGYAAGKVIGIDTAIIASAHGIGFAIPIGTVRSVLRDLIAGRRIVRSTPGLVAVSVTPQVAFANDLKAERGALVVDVDASGPAGAADIRVGDVITAIDGRRVRDLHDYHTVLWRRRPGDTVEITLDRAGQALTLRVVLVMDSGRPPPSPR